MAPVQPFDGLKVLLISVGLPTADKTRELLEAGGASVIAESDTGSPGLKFDVAITGLTSASRIGRHLPRDAANVGLKVVSTVWVQMSSESGTRLEWGDYLVDVPEHLRPEVPKPVEPMSAPRPKRTSTIASLAAEAADRRRKAVKESPAKEGKDGEADSTQQSPASVKTYSNTLPQDFVPPPQTLPNRPAQRTMFMSHGSHGKAANREANADSDDDGSDDGSAGPRKAAAAGQLAPGFINSKYACAHPTPLKSPNDAICAELAVLAEVREFNGNDMNSLAYRRAVAAIRAYPQKLRSPGEANKILGVGAKIASKVDEFLTRGHISEAQMHRRSPDHKLMKMFSSVYGAGPVKARNWVSRGYKTIQDVREREPNLTAQQQMGLKYWDDLSQRIPRSEVEEIAAIVTKAAREIDSGITSTIVGGYRRGKPDSGDVDVLLAHPKEGGERGLLAAVVAKLKDSGFLVEMLMYTEHTPADSEREHNGIADQGFGVDCLDKAYTIVKGPSGKFRQVDIVVCPIQVYGCAVVGWSGSTMFERSIREYSGRELGLQFQSWGIFRKDNGERIECRDERDVFTIFNLPYIPPEMRCA